MPTYKITSTLGYHLTEPENTVNQTTKEIQSHVKLQHDGETCLGAHAMQHIWLRMTRTEQGDIEQAMHEMSFDKAFLLGMVPLMIVLNPEYTLERAIDAGFPLWKNKNNTSFASLIAPAQHLACSIQPSAVNGICALFQHPQMVGHIALEYSHDEIIMLALEPFVSQLRKPVIIDRALLKEPELIFEHNESGPYKGFLRNMHAFCFADVERAKQLGAYFDPNAGGSAYGSVECSEASGILAGYNWRTKGALPLLPKGDQAHYFLRMVAARPGVARGNKTLRASLAVDLPAFRAALLQLTSAESEILVTEGILTANHLENLNDAGRNAILERDLGL